MSKFIDAAGACLCGAVKMRCNAIKNEIVACHCSICRKWMGGPFLGLETSTGVNIEGEEYVGIYESSDWAERAFCKQCGTHLFYRLKQGGHYSVPAGVFDVGDNVSLATQIFIEEKPAYYDFANKTRTMTGQEVFDAWSAEK